MNQIEILSPAGSYESLQAAIQGGCHAVYFGASSLNMRSRSSANFNTDDISNIIGICHENNVKAYLTLNTIVYNNELDEIHEITRVAKDSDVDAIIASDVAVMSICNDSGIPVHASTQLNISNNESVRFFSRFCDVMVLARELDLEQVSSINNFIQEHHITGPSGYPVRTEVFVHGALCMSVSGKCFLSFHEDAASANRGACYQPCRREYQVFDDKGKELKLENNYILSPKDLSTIKFIDKILDSGVSVLKLEGRGRSPEYVMTVTSAYRTAVDHYASGNFDESLSEKLENQLKTVYNRGFWEGHYLGKNLSEWNTDQYGSKATTRKIYLGKGLKYFKKIKVGEFLIETGTLSIGSKFYIMGPTTGVIRGKVSELRKDDGPVDSVSKGDVFSMPVDNMIRPSDKLYIIVRQE